MNPELIALSGCGCCVSRRRFLSAGCGACVAAAAGGLLPWRAAAADAPASGSRPRVRLVFACFAIKQDRPTWPHIGYDFTTDIERVTKTLQRLCPEVEFLPVLCHTPEAAKNLVAGGDADRIDGYLVYQMNNWVQVMQTVVASGKPTLVADFPFSGSGGFLVYTSGMRRKHKNFSVVASTKIEDLAESARCFTMLKQGRSAEEFAAACDRVRRQRTPAADPAPCQDDPLKLASVGQCLEAMKRSRLVTVGGRMQNLAKEILQRLGIEVIAVDFKEMAAAYAATDAAKARPIAARWKSAARSVTLDAADETLEKSARQYLAQEALLAKHQAEAITINCLGGFYGGHLTAYPCLGFVELLNSGRIGACEADLLSTVTMIAVKHLAGRPGFISDPVMDTSKRQIIYAHCVAPTKMFGPAGPTNPFEILTHAEDRRGASVRSFLPQGYMTSTLEIHPGRQEILFHRAKAVDNVVMDRACRTKLAGEVVGDVERLLTFWDVYGWHRVTFYGDLREPMKELASTLRFRFVEEA
jgi:L-fucose isomerase-like protein